MAHSVRIPQEMFEEVVSHLVDHRAALLNCSMASRSLLHASRLHLFSEVNLKTNNLGTLLELLNEPYSSLTNIITTLVVTAPHSAHSTTERVQCTDFQANKTHLKRLASLHTVRFLLTEQDDIPLFFWRTLESLPGVYSIEAEYIYLKHPGDFFARILSLPVLKRFSIERPTIRLFSRWIEDLDLAVQRRSGHCNKLRATLHMPLLDLRCFSDMSTRVTFGWLLSLDEVLAVKSLKFELEHSEPFLQLYLNKYGATIQELCITLPEDPEVLENQPTFNFGSLTHLQHLEIEGMYLCYDEPDDTIIFQHFLRGLFSQLFESFTHESVYPPLRRISLSTSFDRVYMFGLLGLPDYAILQSLTWLMLPDIIESSFEPFGNLFKSIEVTLSIRSTISQAQWADAESSIRAGVWRRVSECATLRVVFDR